MGAFTTYFRRHFSAFLFSGFVFTGIVLFCVGNSLSGSTNSYLTFASSILIALAGTLISAAIAAVILNLTDIQQYLANYLAAVFSDNTITSLLSEDKQHALRRNVLFNSVSTSVLGIENTLYEHVERSARLFQTLPFLQSYNLSITMNQHRTYLDAVEVQIYQTYRIVLHHLKRGTAEVRLFNELTRIPAVVNDRDYVAEFECTINDVRYGKKDLQYEPGISRHSDALGLSFTKSVTEDADVTIILKALTQKADPVHVLYARYPTRGMRVDLSYSDNCRYDCAWFRSWNPLEERNAPSRGFITDTGSGISAVTQDWVLPGEGVTIYWQGKSD